MIVSRANKRKLMNMNETTMTADSPSTEIALILGTAGHIDHGKTALIHALTGKNTDRLPEEQKRGITIELGFAQLHLKPLVLIRLFLLYELGLLHLLENRNHHTLLPDI